MRAIRLVTLALLCVPLFATAGDLTPADREFFDKHVNEIVKITPTRLDDAAVTKVFSTAFFKVNVLIKAGDSSESQDMIVARVEDKLVTSSGGHSDEELPDLAKMINPKFKLKTDADGKTLQAAIDAIYPIINETDKKLATVKHSGKQWTLVRGQFFNNNMGYVFTTDEKGAITAAKYVMKLP